MQRIIIDTNVLVSSILSRSYPNFIIRELFLKNKIHLCISLAIGIVSPKVYWDSHKPD